jgi:CheY-like chemotaxis protein
MSDAKKSAHGLANLERVKILLADDSPNMHRAVQLGLKGHPYEVLTCDNGEDALRMAKTHHPHVILADLDMPGLTGAELVKAVKADPSLSNIRTVLLLSTFEEIDEKHLESIPADARLWKPFETQALVAVLSTVLKNVQRKSAEPTDPRPERTLVERTLTERTLPERTLPPLPTRQSDPDVEKALTDETFQEVEKTAASTIDDELPLVTQEEAAQNLWSFVEVSPPPRMSADPTAPLQRDESEVPSFEIIKPDPTFFPTGESAQEETFADLKLDAPEAQSLKVDPESWGQDPDFSTFHQDIESKLQAEFSPAAKQSALSEAELRTLIRQELREAFDSWLKAALENQLQSVLEELDQT